ncbi:MAG TPA: hypothetical protein VFX25_01180 [Streptosporangiaceae bacterium]|nr:hypothetical protein [Streptosporangiaceae bacterium]
MPSAAGVSPPRAGPARADPAPGWERSAVAAAEPELAASFCPMPE